MGCNCGKKAEQFAYRYTSPAGIVTTFRTEIEAKAAVIRQGGGTWQAVPK
jgi:hypothetical protein